MQAALLEKAVPSALLIGVQTSVATLQLIEKVFKN